MDDLISRKAAIDALKKISFSHWFECGEYLSEDTREIEIISSSKALETIEALPSVQPERKNGHWLRYGEDGYPNNEDTVFWQCDQCLEQYTGRTKRIPNYCPNCGADMRGGDSNE